MTLQRHTNSAWTQAKPALSVLIPFYHDDATELLSALDAQSANVEILIYDDGTGKAQLTERLVERVDQATSPVCLITAANNLGRSKARNALQQAARSEWVLFLDADMRPSTPDFLQTYLNLISETNADIIFGGFEVETENSDADRDLHRALSEVSDCLSLAERQAGGPQYVASSNLCVAKHVLEMEPFDDGFAGWGWEDSEWAARVSKRFTLLHADNPALHLGLETTDTLLRRFATSGPNYKRFINLHPDLAPQLALYRISIKLGHFPGQKFMRPILKALVKTAKLPMRLRLVALKLWRASHYAEALQ